MRAQAQQDLMMRPAPLSVPQRTRPGTVLAQAKSTLGSGASTLSAPPIVDAGRPLDHGTRSGMESGFGQDFSHIRVHDDARAHDNARALGARAYAAGDHIVFGEGAYRPESSSGRALIAHELAHSVQQGGVQMKADGPMPAAADAALEAEADHAAAAVTAGRAAPALSRIGVASVFRKDDDDPVPAPATDNMDKVIANTGMPDLPAWVTGYAQEDSADSAPVRLRVYKDLFEMPLEKGGGDWVKTLYDSKSDYVSTIFPKKNFSVHKEGSATAEYRDIWLGKYGFNTTTELVTAIKKAGAADAAIQAVIDKDIGQDFLTNLARASDGLKKSGSAVDHIIEKHMGGASTGENLQLFNGPRNSLSGSQSAKDVAALARELAAPGKRGASASEIQIVFKKVKTQPPGAKDATYHVEDMLRLGKVTGDAKLAEKKKGKPVKLVAGVNAGVAHLPDTGTVEVEDAASRVLGGAKLLDYTRSPGNAPVADKIKAVLDNKALGKLGVAAKDNVLVVTATKETGNAGAGSPATPAAAATSATKDVGIVAAGETRRLAIAQGPAKIAFYYPYLSPGYLTSIEVKDDGIHGTGIIEPSVKFLGNIDIKYGPNVLEMVGNIDAKKINDSAFMKPLANVFRFKNSALTIDLMKFKPHGEMNFEVGPANKPVLAGKIEAGLENGEFFAKGTLKPAGPIPGVREAAGEVIYRPSVGWSGKMTASSATFSSTGMDVELGFHEKGGRFAPYGTGSIRTNIRDKAELKLGASWHGQGIEYWGHVLVEKPLPFLKSVKLEGAYKGNILKISGETGFNWKGIDTTIHVDFIRKDGEEGGFSGSALIQATVKKAELDFRLKFDEAGEMEAEGSVAYPFTPNIKPKLKVSAKKGRINVGGGVDIGSIELMKKWPGPNGGNVKLFKDVGMKFPVPLPVPIPANVFGEITASASFGYSLGPVALIDVKLNGSLYPLEDDPKIEASLKGAVSLPGEATLGGSLGANIGVEIAAGAVGIKGGISVDPVIKLMAAIRAPFSADYKEGAFSFFAEAAAKGSAELSLGINLNAKIYAAYGVFSHDWTHRLADYKWPLGGEMQLYMGSVGYGKEGVKWPNLAEIKTIPAIDPLGMVEKLLKNAKDEARKTSDAEKAADAALRREIARMDRGPKL